MAWGATNLPDTIEPYNHRHLGLEGKTHADNRREPWDWCHESMRVRACKSNS